MTRIRLLARAQINGALHESGDVVDLPAGQLGPHRTTVASNHGAQIAGHRYMGEGDPDASYARQDVYDEPLYVVLDEGVEHEREEMHARHEKERAELDRVPEREELAAKHARERAELDIKAQESEVKARQKREQDTLKLRQDAEATAFDKRVETPPIVPPPIEADKESLQARHKSETENQKLRHDEEMSTIEGRKELATKRPEDRPAKPADEPRPFTVNPPANQPSLNNPAFGKLPANHPSNSWISA